MDHNDLKGLNRRVESLERVAWGAAGRSHNTLLEMALGAMAGAWTQTKSKRRWWQLKGQSLPIFPGVSGPLGPVSGQPFQYIASGRPLESCSIAFRNGRCGLSTSRPYTASDNRNERKNHVRRK